ncbi:Unconventional myosin-Vc [Zancudomyces culisetae]|uniref:Unconventional myosin-Vc n=1 Tax=Zancudomyces culisetae TaxID=1213189 RepID=A0A1R1PHS8_ZANCU|nr:Unconventional myosin-Vc [Zancudomyces culisetae]|eukprot:OMH80498.1 Unconventional myosin-Vc [Zancudomyces culisetae]
MELENKRGQENEKNKIVSGASMERRRSSDREKGKGEITVRITNADRELSKEILRECIGDTRQYQVGLSKVFFRAGQWAKMEHLRKQLLGKSATVIQKYVRRMIMRSRFISYKGSVFVIQNWWANEMVQRLRVARVRVKFFQLVKRKVMEYREQAAREAAAVAERKAKEEAARIEELRAKQKLLEVKMAEEQEMPRGNIYQRMYGLPCREWMVPTTSYDQHIWNKAAKSPFLSNYGPHEQVYCYTSDDEVVKQLVERRRTEVLQESAKSSKRRDNDNDEFRAIWF